MQSGKQMHDSPGRDAPIFRSRRVLFQLHRPAKRSGRKKKGRREGSRRNWNRLCPAKILSRASALPPEFPENPRISKDKESHCNVNNAIPADTVLGGILVLPRPATRYTRCARILLRLSDLTRVFARDRINLRLKKNVRFPGRLAVPGRAVTRVERASSR